MLQVLAFALTTVVLLGMLRRERPEVAVVLSVAAGAVLLLFVVRQVVTVVDQVERLIARVGVDQQYVLSLLKVIGIAYLAEFGAQVCRDAGEGGLAAKVELAGKVFILLLAVPIFFAVVETLLRLLPAGGGP
jgi:stage III sporulation protein AD